MDIEKHISETAFLVNESRARMVELSKDIYSRLWVTERTKKIWNDFAKHVYPHDDLELSIRNRYFLEHLKKFVLNHENPVFANIGAGFTSYPFLLEKPCQCIEVDCQHVVSFKKEKIAKWQKEGLLPKREIEYFATDLEKNIDILKELFQKRIHDRMSFVLLEGITYYLEKSTLNSLLMIIKESQSTGSLLGIEFWKPDIATHPVFVRLKDYFKDHFGWADRDYNLFDGDYLRSVKGYKIFEITDTTEQERVYLNTHIMEDYENILPTDFSILERVQP